MDQASKLIIKNPEQYNQIRQSWESSDECSSDDDDPNANVSDVDKNIKTHDTQAVERQKEEEIFAQEAMEYAAQREAMENDMMMQNELEAEMNMVMNDIGDQQYQRSH